MKISVLVYVLVLMLMVQRCSSGILAGIAAATGTVIAGGSATGAAKIIIGKCFVSNRFTVKPVLSDNSKRSPKSVFKTNYRLMQVKSIAECFKRAFCNTFDLH